MLKLRMVLLVIVMLFGAVYYVLIIVAPKQAVASTYEAVAGQSMEGVKDEGYLGTLLGETRQIGVFGLTATFLTAFILFAAFRKTQKWAWWAILISLLFSMGFSVIRHFVIGDMLTAVMALGGMVVGLVGVMLPIKNFFGKKS